MTDPFEPFGPPGAHQHRTWQPSVGGYASKPTDSLLIAVPAGVGVGLWIFVVRAPIERAIIVGLTVMIAVWVFLLLIRLRSAQSRPRLPDVPKPARALAPRWQLADYDLMRWRPVSLSPETRARLRFLADGYLARHGVEFESDRARAILGDGPHRLLANQPEKDPSAEQLEELTTSLRQLFRRSAESHNGSTGLGVPKGLHPQ